MKSKRTIEKTQATLEDPLDLRGVLLLRGMSKRCLNLNGQIN